jgi:hypothetical protein
MVRVGARTALVSWYLMSPAVKRAVLTGALDVRVEETAHRLCAYQRSNCPGVYLAVVIPTVFQQDEHVRFFFVVTDSIDKAAHRIRASEGLEINLAAILNVDRFRVRGRAYHHG